MSDIEAVICVVLFFMAVPDICRKLGRPSLIYSVFVVFGLILHPVVSPGTQTMLKQAGEVGFLLLLFEVGLEIDLPRFRDLVAPMRFALTWALLQYPVILACAMLAGADLVEALVCAAALTGCSVGMGYPAWKAHESVDGASRSFLLRVMVVLEMMAIVVLSVESTALASGISSWILLKLAGIVVAVVLISQFAGKLSNLFQHIIERTTQWRVHFLVLLVFVVCAIGERLGLSAAKTAFFFGLFVGRTRHRGVLVEEYMAPVSQRFLIPIFFVGLGLQFPWDMLLSWTSLQAVGAAFLLLGLRQVMHRSLIPAPGIESSYLLFCPNLSIAALAASALFKAEAPALAGWLLIVGLMTTIPALLLLPVQSKKIEVPPPVAATG